MERLSKEEVEIIGVAAIAANVAYPDGCWHLKPGQTIQTPIGVLSVVEDIQFSRTFLLLNGEEIKSVHSTRRWVNLPRWQGDNEHWNQAFKDREHALLPE